MATATLDEVDGKDCSVREDWDLADNKLVHLRSIISNLYFLIVQAHDYHGAGTQRGLSEEMYVVLSSCLRLDH